MYNWTLRQLDLYTAVLQAKFPAVRIPYGSCAPIRCAFGQCGSAEAEAAHKARGAQRCWSLHRLLVVDLSGRWVSSPIRALNRQHPRSRPAAAGATCERYGLAAAKAAGASGASRSPPAPDQGSVPYWPAALGTAACDAPPPSAAHRRLDTLSPAESLLGRSETMAKKGKGKAKKGKGKGKKGPKAPKKTWPEPRSSPPLAPRFSQPSLDLSLPLLVALPASQCV